MVICHNDGMVMIFCDGTIAINGFFNGFATPLPSPLNVFLVIDHCYRWFFNGFPKFWYDGQQWFWSN